MSAIAIDADGVLAAFGQSFIAILHELYPNHPFTIDKWTTWNYGGMVTNEELYAVWEVIRATVDFWMTLRPYQEGIRALAVYMMSHADNDVHIVTSREPTRGHTVAKQTRLWLQHCGISDTYNYLGVIPVANSSNKAGVYRAAGISYSIDDKGPTVEQCDQMKGDHQAYLLDRPWNQDAKVKRRVASVEEFLKEVK